MADIPEEVAYKLLLQIARSENKGAPNDRLQDADRKWILDTYAECLEAVKGKRSANKTTSGRITGMV